MAPSVPPHPPQRIAILDDDASVASLLRRMLVSRGLDAVAFTDTAQALLEVEHSEVAVLLLDVGLPDRSGLDVLAEVKRLRPELEVIMVTADDTAETAVRALRLGAYDYILKARLDADSVAAAIARATERQGLVRRAAHLERLVDVSERHPGIVTRSPALRAALSMAEQVASTDASVLIRGETGTGKEVFARLVHSRSRRSRGPFIPVTCSGLPDGLLDSELFGHERGSFTGATGAHKGVFEEAAGGTVFLDEIGDAPPATQLKLLRTLQEHEIRPLGASAPRPVDARVIAATHVDLEQAIAAGKFRQDLYFRLDVVTIELPPLRARPEDVAPLATHFLARHAAHHGRAVSRIAPEAMDAIQAYDWPGNVRELEHAIERAVVLAQGEEVGLAHLPVALTRRRRSEAWSAIAAPGEAGEANAGDDLLELPFAESKARVHAAFERAYAARLLEASGGNLSAAARRAGLDRSNLRRLLARNGLLPAR